MTDRQRRRRGRRGTRPLHPEDDREQTANEAVASQIGNQATGRLVRDSGGSGSSSTQALPVALARTTDQRSAADAEHGAARPVQRDDGPRSYRQQRIRYRTHEYDSSSLPQVGTTWGTNLFSEHTGDGKSGFHMGHFLPTWSSARGGAGTPTMTVHEPLLDYRAGNFSNDEFHPDATAHVSWEHRSPDVELENVTPTLEYNPDGGGGMRLTTLYHYGGWVEEGGVRRGQHNIRLVFTYDTQMSESSSVEFGGEFGGEAGKVSAKASSSTTVGQAARTWKRDIAFESLSG